MVLPEFTDEIFPSENWIKIVIRSYMKDDEILLSIATHKNGETKIHNEVIQEDKVDIFIVYSIGSWICKSFSKIIIGKTLYEKLKHGETRKLLTKMQLRDESRTQIKVLDN